MWINFSLKRFSMGIYSTAWITKPLSRLRGVNTGQRISRKKHRKLDGLLKLRRCGIRGISPIRNTKRRLTIPKPIRSVIYHRITIRNDSGIGIMPRKFAHNFHRSVPSIILRFMVLMADDSGGTRDALERFWRNVFGGFASARFHRPDSGVGLSEIAQAHLKSMRTITDEMDIFTCKPHNDLLSNREDNGAYTIANPGEGICCLLPKRWLSRSQPECW